MKDYVSVGIYAVGTAVIVGLIVWYTNHVWSDCLDDNSFLTCMRMLNKG